MNTTHLRELIKHKYHENPTTFVTSFGFIYAKVMSIPVPDAIIKISQYSQNTKGWTPIRIKLLKDKPFMTRWKKWDDYTIFPSPLYDEFKHYDSH